MGRQVERRQRDDVVRGDIALPGHRVRRQPGNAEALAAELDVLRRDMLNALGHEMRTPLTVILGFADLMLDNIDGPLSDGQRDAVVAIRDAALQQLALLDDALTLARSRSDPEPAEPLQLARLDLTLFIADTCRRARAKALSKGLELTCESGDGPMWVRADPVRLRRAIDQLVGNAVTFTTDGAVSVRCLARGGDAVVEVADTGIGIASDDLGAIFDDFRQLEQGPTRRYGGLGLGLALVRTLVEAHGGTVEVASAPGRGSTFTVTLPLAS